MGLHLVVSRNLPSGYEDLAAAVSAPSVFLAADWIDTWLEVFGDRHDIASLAVYDEDGLVGATLLAIAGERTGLRLRRATIAGQRPTTGEHLDIVARPGFERPVAELIVRELTRGPLRRRWDVLTIQRMRADSPMLPHLVAALESAPAEVEVLETGSSPYLSLPADDASLLAMMSRNFRGQVKQTRNRVERLGNVRLQTLDDGLDVDRGLDELFRLHRLRWGDASGFATPDKEAFHRRLAKRLADLDRLYLAVVEVDGRAVAARYDFVHDQKIWCIQGGWDPDYQHVRLGMFTTDAVIRWGIERGLREYDFLAGEHGYKKRWADGERPLVALAVSNRRSPRGLAYGLARRLTSSRLASSGG